MTEMRILSPKGIRLQIGAFGRRNVGKSTVINALMRQNLVIMSEIPGSTTDPVEKACELLPIGPVLFVDTAGIDDEGTLGSERVAKTKSVFDRVEIAMIVVDAMLGKKAWGTFEEQLLAEMKARKAPIVIVVNKTDSATQENVAEIVTMARERGLTAVPFSAKLDLESQFGAPDLCEELIKLVPEQFLSPPPLLSDLVSDGSFVLLVTPIDKEAPKGRLILPQVQSIRDLLDAKLGCVVVQENMLATALEKFAPSLVVTDSQAFRSVAKIVPEETPLTSFSILFARQKSDLKTMITGARMIERLTPTSRVLIAEACAHHPVEEDIGTVKIPRLLRQKVGEDIRVDFLHGHDFPSISELKRYGLVIHCGGCMFNRREMLTRLERANASGTPMTNYGLAIAELIGILERAIRPLGL